MKIVLSKHPIEIFISEASENKVVIHIRGIENYRYELEEEIDKIKIFLSK